MQYDEKAFYPVVILPKPLHPSLVRRKIPNSNTGTFYKVPPSQDSSKPSSRQKQRKSEKLSQLRGA
jgi:hypothetical protein